MQLRRERGGDGAVLSEGGVRPSRVVVDTSLLDDHLGLSKTVENFAIEPFIAEVAVEGPAEAILSG